MSRSGAMSVTRDGVVCPLLPNEPHTATPCMMPSTYAHDLEGSGHRLCPPREINLRCQRSGISSSQSLLSCPITPPPSPSITAMASGTLGI